MALVFTLLLGAGVLVLGSFGYFFTRDNFIGGTEEVINSEMHYLLAMEPAALTREINAPAPKRAYYLTDAAGHKTGGNLAALPAGITGAGSTTLVFETHGNRFVGKAQRLKNGGLLLAAVDITDFVAVGNLMLVLTAVAIVLMLLVILSSFLISTFVVNRTNRIALTAQNIIETGSLSQRIDVGSGWDDLSYASSVVNGLLSRIETLVEGVQRVSDNIAHDLRTPLTRLRNNLDTLQKDNPETAEKTAQLIREADSLLATFSALLRISRLETARAKNNFTTVSLSTLLRDVMELYEPLAEEKEIALAAEIEDISLHGDKDLLFQAFANLLDNAIKFSPRGGRIDMSIRHIDGHAQCIFADNGPGIPAAERDKVFTRFYRGDDSRSTPGSGLGLSLVAAVISLHDGNIDLEDNNPGLRVKITL